jgi:hypothetical protein
MSTAKLIAERDIRKYLTSIGKSYITVSLKTLNEFKITRYEIP